MEAIRIDIQRLMDGVYPGEERPLVFGEGNTDARVMLIGEAPGEQEAVQGRPFVEKPEKILTCSLKQPVFPGRNCTSRTP